MTNSVPCTNYLFRFSNVVTESVSETTSSSLIAACSGTEVDISACTTEVTTCTDVLHISCRTYMALYCLYHNKKLQCHNLKSIENKPE